LGGVNEEQLEIPMEEIHHISRSTKRQGDNGRIGGKLRSNERCGNPSPTNLCQKLKDNSRSHENRDTDTNPTDHRLGENGGGNCVGASGTDFERTGGTSDHNRVDPKQHSDGNGILAPLENGIPLGRHREFDDRRLHVNFRVGDLHKVHENEDTTKQEGDIMVTLSHTGSPPNDMANKFPALAETWLNTDAVKLRSIPRPSSTTIPAIDGPLLQERCQRRTSEVSSSRDSGSGSNSAIIEARGCKNPIPGELDPLQLTTGELCSHFQDGESYIPSLKPASITIAKKSNKVATKDDNNKYPCHFPATRELDLTQTKNRMNNATRKRFEEVFRLSTGFNPKDLELKNPMRCHPADAIEAVKNGIATRLPEGTPITCHAFSVIEHKLKFPFIRRRAISWALLFNILMEKKGYTPKVDLKHHSKYFHRVLNPCGATFDLQAGFFQVPLPSDRLFTFIDEEGKIFGLTRLPMGISTAPELMQIITSTLAGDPLFVKPEYAAPALVDVWIDNILFSGAEKKVQLSVDKFRKSAAECKATINEKESIETSNELDFIGVHFDFKEKAISLAPKNKEKIKKMVFSSNMTLAEVESAVARLMYASSVVGVPLVNFFFALKFLRRKLSDLNRGKIKRQHRIVIPESVLKDLNKWRTEIEEATPRKIINQYSSKSFTMWSDASTLGWGAVLIDNESQQVFVVADKWCTDDATLHINILECKAIEYALSRFEMAHDCNIFTFIDNTSTLRSVNKGYSKSESLNQAIERVFRVCQDKKIRFEKPQYVKSKLNVADFWSRIFQDERKG
jgi:hypothetical protein